MKSTKKVLVVLTTLLVLLVIEVGINVYHLITYKESEQIENEKWTKMEQRIFVIENKVSDLEMKINK